MYHFIVNLKSRTGRAKKIWEDLEEILDRDGVEYQRYKTEYAGHAIEIARKIMRKNEGVVKIVVLGGDGTFNEVITGIREFDRLVLGYIPSGSGNDLARGLGLPKDPEENLKRILHSTEYWNMDLGCLSWDEGEAKRYFGVSAGVGVDADVCRRVLHSNLKRILNKLGFGKLTYIIITLQSLFAMPNLTARIVVDGDDWGKIERGIFIAVMNQKTEGGGVPMSPQANAFDGKLNMCCVSGLSKLICLPALVKLMKGKHEDLKAYRGAFFKEADIILETPFVWHTDGEIISYNTVMHVECIPGALKMIK